MTPLMITLLAWSAVLFSAVFALIVVTTYWPGRRAYFEQQGEIPLHDGSPGSHS